MTMVRAGKIKGTDKIAALEAAFQRAENPNPRFKASKADIDTAVIRMPGASKFCAKVGDIWYWVADAPRT